MACNMLLLSGYGVMSFFLYSVCAKVNMNGSSLTNGVDSLRGRSLQSKKIEGTLLAPPRKSDWSNETIRHWIIFNGVRGLTVTSGGAINGNGKDLDGTENLHIKNIVCGPGHTVSIGSLVDHNSEAHVNTITVDNVRLHDTTNGARIETWQGGRGYVKNIVFQNMIMENVWNPIIIDQNYCDSATPCKKQASAVQVSNVAFKNIRGTSASKEDAIKLDCSRNRPCHGIALKDVKLTIKGGGGDAKSIC
uniref:Polygalacturonase n=1 Tax=Oryza brachyantha TaxID=4533 RepID=J3MJD9_ORYBR